MKISKIATQRIISCIIGILIGYLISLLPLKFEEKVNPITFANFILTILLAFYLEFRVRPAFANTRKEKDILIDQLSEIRKKAVEIYGEYSEIRDVKPLSDENRKKLLRLIRELSNLISVFKETDEYCEITPATNFSNRIFLSYLDFKKALTGGNFEKGTFSFSEISPNFFDNNYRRLLRSILHCVVDVNKL